MATRTEYRVTGLREGRRISVMVDLDNAAQKVWELRNPANRYIHPATNVRVQQRTVTETDWEDVTDA